MTMQTINLGASANDGTGDPLRTAGGKINANFADLYGRAMNLNYAGSFDPATNDSANFLAIWNAARTAVTPLKPEIRLHFGPGTVNLSGLATIQLNPNEVVRITATPQTNIILSTWSAAGLSTYGDIGVFLFFAGTGMDFHADMGGATIWGGGLMMISDITRTAAYSAWPDRFRRLEIKNLNGKKCRKGLAYFSEGNAGNTDLANRAGWLAPSPSLVNGAVVGDGTLKDIVVDSVANAFVGQDIFFDLSVGADGTWRNWRSKIAAITGTTITPTQALPNGLTIPDNARWSGMSRPVYHFDYFNIENIDWEFVADDDNSHRLVYFGNISCISGHYFGAKNIRIKHGQHFAIQFGSTANGFAEYFTEILEIAGLDSEDFIHSDDTAGGILLFSGLQTARVTNITIRGRLSRNDIALTLKTAAVAGQQYAEVTDNLSSLVKSAGFTITNGEPVPVALAAANLATTLTTTVTGGDVAAGASTLSATNASAFAVRGVLSVLVGSTLRYYGFTRSSNTLTLLTETTDAIILNGATISQIRSGNQTPGDVFASPSTTKLLRCPVDNEIPEGEWQWLSIVAVDTARSGAHRLYFDGGPASGLRGGMLPGRGLIVSDVNAVADNGDESIYFKSHGTLITGVTAYNNQVYQGIVAFKGGEFDRTPLHASNSGLSNRLIGFNYVFGWNGPVDITKREICNYVQQTGVETGNGSVRKAINALFTHNATPQSDQYHHDYECHDALCRGLGGAVPFLLSNAGGKNWRIHRNVVRWHPYTPNIVNPYRFQHSIATATYFLDFEDIEIIDCSVDTTRHYNEAGLSGQHAVIGLESAHNTAAALYAMRRIFIDGNLGTSGVMGALKFLGGGRIGQVRLGPNFDYSGLTGTKSQLICLGSGSSSSIASNTTPPARLSTTLAAAASANDTTIEINHAHAQKIPKGSHVTVTKNSGSFSTWTTEEGGTDGILKLADRVDGAANSGNAVTIRPVGEIEVDPLARTRMGLSYRKRVFLASGTGSFSGGIAGIYPRFLHSAGAPKAEHVWIRSLSGDIDGLNILYGYPVITENNTSQAGGSIAWTFKDPMSPATPKNLTQDTLIEWGWSVPTIQFNV